MKYGNSSKGSNVMREKGVRGQTVVCSHGRDDSSYDGGKKSKEMGGSTSNVAHSLSGASAVQHVKGK